MTTPEQDVEYEGLLHWLRANIEQVIEMTPSMVGTVDQALAQHVTQMERFGVDFSSAEQRRAYVAGLAHGVGSVLAVSMSGRLAMTATQELIHRIGFPVEIEDYVGVGVGLPPDPFEEDA